MVIRFSILAARVALAACLVFAAYECLLFARAAFFYRQDTATSIPAAFALVPFNASYASRLAAWQPDRKEELLKKAVALNPFDVESWMQLGLNAELQKGDAQAAERYYLRAAQIDKMFRPRWTLTNFYFRQQRPSEFFPWARATLEITPYQAEPVFAQMWLMKPDPAKLSGVIPDRPSILVQYALYLAKENQFDAIPPVMQRLTGAVDARNARAYGRDDLIGPMEDRMIVAGHAGAALQLWTTLCKAQWLPYTPPNGADPLTNSDFRNSFFGHGFDWAVVNQNGVSFTQNPEEGSVRFTFSGDEPERAPLLRQFIPLQPGQSYRLHWAAEGDGVSAPSGLHWHIYPLKKGGPQPAQKAAATPDVQSEDLLSSSSPNWMFKADTADAGILTLEYARPLGSTLAAGTTTLHSVSLKEDAGAHEKK
jgi:tetratricopeptide (TPR) repeat protein